MPSSTSAYVGPIASKGALSKGAINRLASLYSEFPDALSANGADAFELLHDALRQWDDAATAAVVEAIIERVTSRKIVEVVDARRWIEAHSDGPDGPSPESVRLCLECDPPKEFKVLRLLSTEGHQKIVYEAQWELRHKTVVLKKLSDSSHVSAELFTHGLSVHHPNIIETHCFRNDDEVFLVEEMVDIIDENIALGDGELANLLRDILCALSALEDERHVHGDIKPGNIGRSEGRYILLDFGTSQPLAKPGPPTGSLRTRAPELYHGTQQQSFASDIWALGATVYRLACGHFPLMSKDDGEWPRHDHVARKRWAAEFERRVKSEYKTRVNISALPLPFRPILNAMLAEDADARTDARKLLLLCDSSLGAYLRKSDGSQAFSPLEELKFLSRFLVDEAALALMSYNDQRALHAALHNIEKSPAFSTELRPQLDFLRQRLPKRAR